MLNISAPFWIKAAFRIRMQPNLFTVKASINRSLETHLLFHIDTAPHLHKSIIVIVYIPVKQSCASANEVRLRQYSDRDTIARNPS